MQCPQCKSVNVQQLRGWWESLPAESPHRGRYAPPDEPDVRQWLGVLAVVAGVWVAATGSLGMGVLIALGGLLWGAWMVTQARQYQMALDVYYRSVICLAGYHVF